MRCDVVLLLCAFMAAAADAAVTNEEIMNLLKKMEARMQDFDERLKIMEGKVKVEEPRKPETDGKEADEMKRIVKENGKGKDIDWAFVAKLASNIQAAVAKKQPQTVLKYVEALIREIKDNDQAYISVSNHLDVSIGFTPFIADGGKISYNVLKPFKRISNSKILDMDIYGMGMIYTGRDEDLEANKLDGWDYRLANVEGKEVYASDGSIMIRRNLKPAAGARGKFFEKKKMADKVAKKAFVHLNRDEVDLAKHAGDAKMKLIVADHDEKGLIVRAVFEHSGKEWMKIYGDARECIECLTPELRETLSTKQ